MRVIVAGVGYTIDSGYVRAELQLLGIAVRMTAVPSLTWDSGGRLSGCLEQPGHGITTIVEHPAERHDHRICVSPAQNAGPIRRDALVRVDPHHEELSIESVGQLGNLRTSRSFTQSRHYQ